jgi:hypothetical protein
MVFRAAPSTAKILLVCEGQQPRQARMVCDITGCTLPAAGPFAQSDLNHRNAGSQGLARWFRAQQAQIQIQKTPQLF